MFDLEFSVKKVILRRFLELLVTNIILSSLLTFANIAWLLTSKVQLSLALIVGMVIFMIVNVQKSRHCYFDLRNKRLYYFSNLLSYLIFALLSFAVYCLSPNIVYTWLFSITKFIKYMDLGVPTIISMLIFHIIGILSITVAPVGMRWVFEDIEEEFEE